MTYKEVKKAWYKSRTIILNLLVAIVTGMATIIHEQPIQELFKEYYGEVLMGVTILNIYLRTITTQPVGKTDEEVEVEL